MTLRKTTLCIILGTFTALFTMLYAITQYNILSSFSVLERRQVMEDVGRAENALKGELRGLETTSTDWAAWDATYDFIRTLDPVYVEENLASQSLDNLRLDMILYYDEEGRLVTGKVRDREWIAVDAASPATARISPDSPLFLRSENTPRGGVVMLPSGPLLVAASPILTSASTGPARGTLVMARYLSEQRIMDLSEQVKVRVGLFPLGSKDLSPRLADVADSLRRTGQYQVVPEGETVIRGYALIRDVFGEPCLLLEIETNRDMHHQGLVTLRYNFISLAAIGLTFGLAMHILVERRILSRITGLGTQIAAVRADKNASRDIRVRGRDEITNLATAIREMLEEIERAQDRLAESERRYELATRAAKLGVWDYDYATGTLYTDPSLKAQLGYREQEIENTTEAWIGLILPEDRARAVELTSEAFRESAVDVSREFRMRHKDGGVRWLLVRGVVSRDEAGVPSRALGTAVDVTDLKLAEQSVRHLTREIINAQERERARMARELHDNVAQDLSSLKIACEAIFGAIPDVSPEIRERFVESSRILQGAIIFIREMAYALRPSNLDHLGFLRTVERFCQDFEEKTGIRTRFMQTGMDGVTFDSEAEINLFRVVQEALGNVRRHAKASEVSVKIVESHPRIILRVEDNGVGFHVGAGMSAAMEEKRMGLRGMRERVKLLGGNLRIVSAPGQGTRVIVEIPSVRGGNHGG